MGIGDADKTAASIFDNTATISKNVECKGDFTLIDPFTNTEEKVTDDDFSKINNIANGFASAEKMVVLDGLKSIDGINMQTNYDIFTLSKIDDCDCDNFLFKKSRGTKESLSKTLHNDKIGSINFLPLLGDTTTYYNSSSIFSRVFGGNFTVSGNNYLGSEIVFKTTGIGKDSYNDDRVKIDTYGNLNVLNRGEIRLYSHGKNNFSSFRSSSSTAKPGYTMELPPDKGNLGDSLTIQGVGSGGQISITSDLSGIITSTSIVSAGTGYDLSYPPEIDTISGLNGGVITENGTASNTTSNTSQIYLSSNANSTDDYYNGWVIETVNPNYKKIITDYVGSTKIATLSSSMTTLPTLSTTYKITWNPETGTMQGPLQLSSSANSVNDYYNGWTIIVDVSGTISTGTITDYVGSSRTITVSLSPTVTTDSSTIYSLIDSTVIPATLKISSINSSGQITGISILDGGQGYIPSTTTTINLSSQNRLQWTPASIGVSPSAWINTWGMKVLEGTVQQTGTSTWIYLEDHDTELNDYNHEWVIITTNPSWHASAFQYSSGINALNPVGSLPTTTTSTTYKLIKYTTGVYAGGSGTNSSTTQVNLKSQISHVVNSSVTISSTDNYYQGWIILTYSTGMSTNDPYIGVITSYDGTTGIAQASLKNSNGDFYNSASASSFALSNASILGTNLTVGDGLSGGGVMSSNINVNFDLSTHDNTTDTSSYTTNNTTDKILLYQTSSSNSKLPTMTNFLSSISGTGITISSSGLDIETTQNINELISNYLKIRGSSGNEESIYLNIGKNDTNNLNILPSYTNNELSSITIKSNTSESNDNAYFQYDVGENDNILNINKSGINVKSGTVISLTIDNAGSGYTSNPTLTFEESPMGSTYTATGSCTVTDGSITSVSITYGGEGYITAPTITLSIVSGEASITSTIENRNITGPIGTSTTKFPGKFSSVTIDGDTSIGGTLTGSLTLENTDILNIPSTDNLTFTNSSVVNTKIGYNISSNIDSDSQSVIVGYEAGKDTTSGFCNVYIGYKSGRENITGDYNTFVGHTSGTANTSDHNTFIGFETGRDNTSGYSNTYIGSQAAPVNTTGYSNIAIGGLSLGANTSGHSNVTMGLGSGRYNATGNSNVYIGKNSGRSNNGFNNTFIGTDSGYGISGQNNSYNTFIGRNSGKSITTGSFNTFLGMNSGYDNTTGTSNTFIGYNSGTNNTTGFYNVFIGRASGQYNTTGNYNTYLGPLTGRYNTTGNYNTFIGYASGNANTTEDNILCIGYHAGYNNTSSENVYIGNESGGQQTSQIGNTYIGYYSGKEATSNYNTFVGKSTGKVTTGDNNTFLGFESGLSNTSGYWNTFLGMQAGKVNTSGIANSFLGYQTGISSTTGHYNTFLGWRSARHNTSGHRNTFIGAGCGDNNTTGERNVFIGVDTGYYNTTGDYNTFVGNRAGWGETGNQNIYIGNECGYQSTTADSQFRNTFIGFQCGYNNRGNDNTFIGWKSGMANNYGYNNTFIGRTAGYENTTGYNNTYLGHQSGYGSTGNYNTFSGYKSGYDSTGNYNTFLGNASGFNTTNDYNTFIGNQSGKANTSGYGNTLIGHDAGTKQTTPTSNISIGFASSYENLTGENNVSVGTSSGRTNTSGSRNVNIGTSAGWYIKGNNNISLGHNSGPSSTNTESYKLYIDSNQNGSSSFIYGDMTPGSKTLTINGSLNVTGDITGNLLNVGGTLSNISLTNGFINIIGSGNSGLHSIIINNDSTNNSSSNEITVIGWNAGINLTDGSYNSFFGFESGKNTTNGERNTFMGYGSGRDMITGSYNTFIGMRSGYNTETGRYNTSLGYDSQYNNVSGSYNTMLGAESGYNATSSFNTFLGYRSGRNITTGVYSTLIGTYAGYYANSSYLTLVGYQSGYYNSSSGTSNTALGYRSAWGCRNGDYNISIGYYAGKGNTSSSYGTWSYNVFIGPFNGYDIRSGYFNSAVGYASGRFLTTGDGNTLFGRSSGYRVSTGEYNTLIGYQSGEYVTTGSRNICLGNLSGPLVDDGAVNDKIYIDTVNNGSNSLIYGDTSDSGRFITINGNLNVTGELSGENVDISGTITIPSTKSINIYNSEIINFTQNTTSFYLGYGAATQGGARNRTDDLSNTAVGSYSGYNISSGDENTFYGYQSGKGTSTSRRNTYIGVSAALNNNGSFNVCIGMESLLNASNSSYNCIIGRSAGRSATGSSNTLFGYDNSSLNTGSYNISIGRSAGATSTDSSSYNLYIDSSRKGSDSLIFGNTEGTTSNYIKINGNFYVKENKTAQASSWSNYSDITLKENILPMTEDIIGKIELLNPVRFNWKSNNVEDIGFIAQEMKDIFPLLVHESNNNNILSVDYARLTTYLVKGMKEQNKKIDDLEKELEKQKQKNISLEKYFKDEIEKLRKEFLNK